MDVRHVDTNAMAFVGDAVYEVFVRDRIVKSGLIGAGRLHKKAVHFVNAYAQAAAIKKILLDFSAEEQTLVKRVCNHKSATKAKNVDPVTYKWSTAFEALVGYLHLYGKEERAEEIMRRAVAIIQRKEG